MGTYSYSYRTSPKKNGQNDLTVQELPATTHLQQQEEKKISIATTTESSTAKTEGTVDMWHRQTRNSSQQVLCIRNLPKFLQT